MNDLFNIKPLRIPVKATEVATMPTCFTPEATDVAIGTVGIRPPETGAKLFGPMDGFGVDTVEFDERGSARASGGVYAPDTEWGNERVEYWLKQDPPKLWTGDLHSHPGSMARPSGRAGKGLGDMGYVESVFQSNDIIQDFAIPIVLPITRHCPSVEIAPWIVSRNDPLTPKLAEFRICDPSGFPARNFNPEWVNSVSAGSIKDRDAGLMELLVEQLLSRKQADDDGLIIVKSSSGVTVFDIPVKEGLRTRIVIQISQSGSQIQFDSGRRIALPRKLTSQLSAAVCGLARRIRSLK
jgi:hypothetical protein